MGTESTENEITFKVYKAVIVLDKQIKYIDPYVIELDTKTYHQFKWDRINRFDFLEQNAIILLGENKAELAAYLLGFYHATKISEDFSDEKKQQYRDIVNKSEEQQ